MKTMLATIINIIVYSWTNWKTTERKCTFFHHETILHTRQDKAPFLVLVSQRWETYKILLYDLDFPFIIIRNAIRYRYFTRMCNMYCKAIKLVGQYSWKLWFRDTEGFHECELPYESCHDRTFVVIDVENIRIQYSHCIFW